MFRSSCFFGVDKSGELCGPSPTQVAVLGDLKLDNLFGFTGLKCHCTNQCGVLPLLTEFSDLELQ